MPQRKASDLIGKRVGKLVVLARSENLTEEVSGKGKRAVRATWLCRCDCGDEITVSSHSLSKGLNGTGGTRSCGCLMGVHARTHGKVGSRVYHIWAQMLQRCRNPRNSAYRSYGARGITVCDAWLTFENFCVDMGDPEPGMSLDRIDNSKGYSKENCRWASRVVQANNRRTNVVLELNGERMTLAQWGRRMNLSTQCIRSRLNAGWSLERALTVPKV